MLNKRINRKTYAIIVLGGFVITNFILIISEYIEKYYGPAGKIIGTSLSFVALFFALYYLFIAIVSSIGRVSDLGISRWFTFLFLIITPGVLILFFVPGSKKANKFGPPSTHHIELKKALSFKGTPNVLK